MRDLHLDIVGDDREVIRRQAVRSQDDEVFDVRAVDRNGAVHQIVERDRTGRNFDAYDARLLRAFARGDFVRRERVAGAIVLPRAAGLLRGCAFRGDYVGRTVAVVTMTARDESIGHRTVTVQTLGLKVRREWTTNPGAFVPGQTQPAQAIEDSFDHVGRRA